jgi:NAD-dependent deacetylase
MSPSALDAACAIIRPARFLFVLTGAGISAESGVPTFRGPGGYWRNRHFSELASPDAFTRDPRLVWDWYLERRRTVRACEPNAAHRALAAWSARGTGRLVTQNVDGLHERAGHRHPIRVHGSLWRNRCTRCGAEREENTLEYAELPVSPCCGTLERPGVVWFGEALPPDALGAADQAARQADAVLVVGTSGVVYPAAGFVELARRRGARVVDVNPEGSELEVDVALRLPAGEAVPALLA